MRQLLQETVDVLDTVVRCTLGIGGEARAESVSSRESGGGHGVAFPPLGGIPREGPAGVGNRRSSQRSPGARPLPLSGDLP